MTPGLRYSTPLVGLRQTCFLLAGFSKGPTGQNLPPRHAAHSAHSSHNWQSSLQLRDEQQNDFNQSDCSIFDSWPITDQEGNYLFIPDFSHDDTSLSLIDTHRAANICKHQPSPKPQSSNPSCCLRWILNSNLVLNNFQGVFNLTKDQNPQICIYIYLF